jgi:hypothetical protein
MDARDFRMKAALYFPRRRALKPRPPECVVAGAALALRAAAVA